MLKKYFIPHKDNQHQPHILRRKAVFGILSFVLLAELIFLVQIFLIVPYTNLFSAILPDVLVGLTNSDRQQNNLGSLETNALLEKAAQLKAQDMADKGYFSHTGPDGKKPWVWLDEAGYNYEYAGENLAVNFVDSSEIEKAWMESGSHRANILSSNFTQIGIGTAIGLYKGRETQFVVQFFGKPVPIVSKTTVAPKTPPVISSTKTPVNQLPAPQDTAVPIAPGDMAVFKQAESGAVAGQTESSQLITPAAGETAVPWYQKILAMPLFAMNYFYFALLACVLLALILKIFIKIRLQYPKLILNGIFILFVVVSILYFNALILGRGFIF